MINDVKHVPDAQCERNDYVRTLDNQRIIREMAGLLSTLGHHTTLHPEECIPEAEALFEKFMTCHCHERALEHENAELKRIACWWCGRSPSDEPEIILTRINPKGLRGVFCCRDHPSRERSLLEALEGQIAGLAKHKRIENKLIAAFRDFRSALDNLFEDENESKS